MRAILRGALAAAITFIGVQAWAQVTLYEHANFEGPSATFNHAENDLRRERFNDRASSIVVQGGNWQLCEEGDFRGHCVVIGPGQYRQLPQLNDRISSLRPVRGGEQPIYGRPGWDDNQRGDNQRGDNRRWDDRRWPERGQLILYEHDNFQGRSVRVGRDAGTLDFAGFNDRASSIVVNSGRWQVCSDAEFRGNCMVLRPGQYANLSAMGMNDRVTSLRLVGPRGRVHDDQYAPLPPGYQGSPPWERER